MINLGDEVDMFRAELVKARYNLEQTLVVAPSDGYVVNIQLRKGVFIRLKTPVMTYLDTEAYYLVALVRQRAVQWLDPGDAVEVAMEMNPGEVFDQQPKEWCPQSTSSSRSDSKTKTRIGRCDSVPAVSLPSIVVVVMPVNSCASWKSIPRAGLIMFTTRLPVKHRNGFVSRIFTTVRSRCEQVNWFFIPDSCPC